MKKALAKIIAIVMIASILLTGAAFAMSSKVQITGSSTNIRKAPSLNSSVIATVAKGEVYEATGEVSVDDRGVEWYQIENGSRIGWVSSRYAKEYGGSDAYVIGARGNSYIRSSNSTDSNTLCTLHQGEKAAYLGETKADNRGINWYKVEFKGKTGWVSSKFTDLKGTSKPSAVKTVTAIKGKTYVRSDYNKDSKILGTLQEGSSLKYAGETRNDDRNVAWYKVEYKGKTGWVSSKYTTLSK